MADTNSVEAKKRRDFLSEKTGSKADDAVLLLAQMDDLSFMLESNLSMPFREDQLNSSSQGR